MIAGDNSTTILYFWDSTWGAVRALFLQGNGSVFTGQWLTTNLTFPAKVKYYPGYGYVATAASYTMYPQPPS